MPKKPKTPARGPENAPQSSAPHTYAPQDFRKPFHTPFHGATELEGSRARVIQGDVAFASAPAFLTGLTALFGAITQKRGA